MKEKLITTIPDSVTRSKSVGFQNYEINGEPIVAASEMDHLEDSLRYLINAETFFMREPAPDPRSRFQKFIDMWKRRLGHAWYALRGGVCD